MNLNEQCEKIRENIEYKKNNKEEDTKLNHDQISLFEDKLNHCELVVSNQEKTYKNELIRQKNKITELNEELSLLSIQMKEKEQEIRINDLKLKELNKIKNYHSEIQSLANNLKVKGNDRALSAKMKTAEKRRDNSNFRTPNVYQRNKPFNDIKFDKKQNNLNDENFNRDEMMKQIESLSKIYLYKKMKSNQLFKLLITLLRVIRVI